MISISIKDLRQNLSKVGDAVSAGQSFTVFRRSRPIGKFVPLDNDSKREKMKETIVETEDGWIDFIDFTEGGKKDGMSGEEFLKVLRSIDN